MPFHRWISIQEDGRVWQGEKPLTINAEALPYLENLQKTDNGTWQTKDAGGEIFGVEAFDEPLIAVTIALQKDVGILHGAYGFQTHFPLTSLVVDPWDRFHGATSEGVPFVMSPQAQNQFFDLVEAYDDDSFQWQGKSLSMRPWLDPQSPVESQQFWTDLYTTGQSQWDQGAPSPIFVDLLPRLKIPRSRILVLGRGAGHDAHFFAQHGHVVTAVDFSSEALGRARQKYGSSENLRWVECDVFKLPSDWNGTFDLVIEHTCYCAIQPHQRNELVQIWRKMLHEQGQLLGVFFVMDSRHQPPFGGSEWEIRQRLKRSFQFLFWGRWRDSTPKREGKELAVFAQRRNL